MAVPFVKEIKIGAYIVKQKLMGRKRYPLVLMLEPLFRCNLACAGCGKIDYPDPILNQRLSVAECLEAVDECGAPIVVIAGGEPLLHREIEEIVEGIIARKKFVYLCTPWGNPCRNYFGWQRPCYLLGEGYAKSFKELMEETDWDSYGTGNYEKCADCMVHSGYEATAVVDSVRHPLKAAAVALRGMRTEGEMAPEIALDRQRPAEYVFSRHVEEAVAQLDRQGADRSGLGDGDRAAQRARRAG